ncbi:MAG: glycosyltransferase WbuB, partial [Bacteroidota bacterium]
MHILIVSQYFWPEQFRINDIALGLKEKGNEVTVLTSIPNYPEGKFFPGYSFFNISDELWNG